MCIKKYIIITGLRKKLQASAKKNDCELISEWSKSIINHLYWCAASTPPGSQELLKAKWKSAQNHIHNIHEHDGPYKKCDHGVTGNKTKWFKPRK